MFNWSPEEQESPEIAGDQLPTDQNQDQQHDEQPSDAELQVDSDPSQQQDAQNPDHQGVIRNVDGAHLVYKRRTSDNTFEELWIYNIGKMQDELKVRKQILSGTDIPTNRLTSPDGKQTYDVWAAGNAELLQVKGLPQ